MKKILFGFIGFVGLMCLMSCDKIAPEEYTIYSGPAIEWTQGDASIAPVQCAYVEKYTGPKCPNCPAADLTLATARQQYGERLVLVSVNHPTGQGVPFPNQSIDPRCDDGTVWDQYFGINAIPAAFINRHTATQYSGAMANITADIASAIAESPVVGVSVSASGSETTIDIAVNLVFAQNYSEPLTLTLAIVEDSLVYKQIDGDDIIDDYVHNHMLRDVITDVWGADINCTGAVGEAIKGTLSYTLPTSIENKDNCHIVAFVSDKSSRQVLNSACCKIE